MKNATKSIVIDKGVKDRITIDNYKDLLDDNDLALTYPEKMFCAMLVRFYNNEDPITPKIFAGYYMFLNMEVHNDFQKIRLDFDPEFRDSEFLKEVRSLDKRILKFLREETFIRMAKIIFPDLSEELEELLRISYRKAPTGQSLYS